MARLLWLPTVLRAVGLTVHEVPGWQTRGLDKLGTILGVTCHATAGSRSATTQGEINVLINGSQTAPPPIAQCLVERGTGDWHVVASGLCYHNLIGWGGPNEGLGNANLVGVEAMNDNRGEPWAPQMLDSYQRGVAAILDHTGRPASRAAAHWEHQPGNKSDPVGIDMNQFRARVAQLIASGGDDMFSDDDRTRLQNIQGRVAEVYPIKSAVLAILDGVTRIDGLDDEIKAQLDATRADLAAARTDLLGEVDQVEEQLAAVPGVDPAVWAQRIAELLIPHIPPGADPAVYLDALRARLES